ncbi:hypothetical protein LTR08_000344 [Meristemomyces frigidus]|nr:hypothetical protein LTR08_000344 [Meristemomyces frigidus]
MPETAAGNLKDRNVQYVPEKVPLIDSASESDGDVPEPVKPKPVESEPVKSKPVKPKPPVWLCPYQDCARHHDVYEQGFRWREHLRRSHKLSREQVEEIETSLRQKDNDGDQRDDAADDGLDRADESGGGAEHAEDEQMVGGVRVDGFLQQVTEELGRGKDVKIRRRRSTNGRKGSKRRRVEEDET